MVTNGLLQNSKSFQWVGCIGFHGNISVKAGITQKQLDLCTRILVATMAICYGNTIVETFPLYP